MCPAVAVVLAVAAAVCGVFSALSRSVRAIDPDTGAKCLCALRGSSIAAKCRQQCEAAAVPVSNRVRCAALAVGMLCLPLHCRVLTHTVVARGCVETRLCRLRRNVSFRAAVVCVHGLAAVFSVVVE